MRIFTAKIKAIGKLIAYEFKKQFIRRKIFIGTYADNEIAMRKWAAGRSIMIVHVEKEKLMKYDYRLKGTALKKTQKHILFYVHDNIVTRWIGWQPNFEHLQIME